MTQAKTGAKATMPKVTPEDASAAGGSALLLGKPLVNAMHQDRRQRALAGTEQQAAGPERRQRGEQQDGNLSHGPQQAQDQQDPLAGYLVGDGSSNDLGHAEGQEHGTAVKSCTIWTRLSKSMT